ncbi:GrpB family protein [Coraliomargarita akajimensis]|uniref:GrpB family protein n=1 Tax=Coraliomargarita akajimensis (strain DSM 45221 / IAM 15411 / JCM 23193 / KCTC 12865 / 04OKA010-24) TaxID=583355 RepID=D5ELY3_CORAD|nr:GrpB family protein [Coraliomargarita akajimensis]ADE53308.1 protein of unknown function UPF0157 [Coraliomargarita akajimensis DSM 45221]
MKIEVVPYSDEWPEAFKKEKRALLELGIPGITRIHHIGSTSVEGLAAKPIIDIMIEVESLDVLDRHQARMESLGYEAFGENGISRRRYYQKGGEHRTHQIHAFQNADPHVCRHLAFRDYLRQHPKVCDEYARLKAQVAADCNHDIDRYCAGKNDFIQFHEARALEYMSSPRDATEG